MDRLKNKKIRKTLLFETSFLQGHGVLLCRESFGYNFSANIAFDFYFH